METSKRFLSITDGYGRVIEYSTSGMQGGELAEFVAWFRSSSRYPLSVKPAPSIGGVPIHNITDSQFYANYVNFCVDRDNLKKFF